LKNESKINFEIENGYAAFRPSGEVSLHKAVELVKEAIASAREQKISKLLVNTNGLTGFESPGLGARYFFIREGAQIAGGMVRIAMVIPSHMIDPEKFGTTVAANVGLDMDVFASEKEALDWLLAI
jgi:hypothetical protein